MPEDAIVAAPETLDRWSTGAIGSDSFSSTGIDRPNVLGVERRGVSPFDLVSRAAKLGGAGAVLVLVGVVLDPAALLPRSDLASARAAGGILGPVNAMLDAFYALDVLAIGVGAVLATLGAALVGVQLATRRDRLAIEVAGDDDVLLATGAEEAAVDDLEAAIDAPTPPESAGN